MHKSLIILVLFIAGAAGVYVYTRSNGPAPGDGAATAAGNAGPPAGFRGGGFRGGGGFARPPMTVEIATATHAPLAEEILVVGNLVGAATVEVVPRVGGRLQTVDVRLGDAVARNQRIAQVEDREIREQVKQAEASFEVGQATIRQREADLALARSNLERSRSLYERELLPRQALDDVEARFQAAQAQLDLARAQFNQAQARLEELRIALAHTIISSPVDGFVGRRYLDPGAFAGTNTPVVSVVDIRVVRLIANIVERDMRRVSAGTSAVVEVDAFPGERFSGRVARVAPVLDPATRTAEMEVEISNPGFRLKPGMYARVRLSVDQRAAALVVPRASVVDVGGRRGVFVPEENIARFRPVTTGVQDQQLVEIIAGLDEGEQVVTTGAAGLTDGSPIVVAGAGPMWDGGAFAPGGAAGERPPGAEAAGPRGFRPPGGFQSDDENRRPGPDQNRPGVGPQQR